MSIRRLFLFLLVAVALLIATGIPTKSNPNPDDELIVGRNVNMVAGQDPITGDPYLQRQNEPSIAVSTRNPMHLLAAANDYRTVNLPFSEGPLPGIDLKAQAGGDAWLGIFKSYNGGQSWTSTLLPGYPQEEGTASPLHGYSTACDPTVRAGSSGLFFTSGIAFDRIEHGRSAIFIARYIDNNTQAIGDMDSIKYLDVNIIDKGTSGQFADKPWIAIDAPKNSDDTVQIYVPVAPGEPGGVQDIPRFNVYIVYSIFLGSSPSGDHSKIMFARSTDCGNTWEKPIKLSEDVHVCQGTNIAVSPKNGTIYVVWRQYAREEYGVPHAIVMCKSDDRGNTFTKATVVDEIDPFDQFTNADRFRTSAFPALAVDHNGLVYVAWSQRGVGSLNGEARIVIKTSKDGINWSEQDPVDNYPLPGGGHQIMPSLTYAGGKLMMTWYDTRKSLGYIDAEGNYIYDPEQPNIADPGPTGMRHTIDAWVIQANPSDPYSDPIENPVFTDSTQVSRYLYQAKTDDASGQLVDADGTPISVSGNPPVIYQAQFNFPNFPIFMEGNAPFMGDYLDITPAPMFLYDDLTGAWRFNTGEKEFDPTLSYITFACNRDVIPPRPEFNWMSYWPPGSGNCDEWTAGLRNQNIYSAPITHGILVGSPVNTKPLVVPSPSNLQGNTEPYIQKRTFLVFVKNLTDVSKLIRLTIDAPDDMVASFWEFEPPPDKECPFELCEDTVVEVPVLPHSSITLTVFVLPYDNPYETFRVNVEEIDGVGGSPTGLRSSIVLNPDPVNTKMIPVIDEYHTPTIITEDPVEINLSDPTMLSALIVYSPYLGELLNFSNPDIVTPGVRHPGVRHDTIINPGVRHTAIESIPEGEVTDLRWRVTNDGDTTSAYSFEAIGETPLVPYQLLIYRVTSTPISAEQCLLSWEEHHDLLLSVENPGVRHPGVRHPGVRHPGVRHNTFFLAPGEEAVITLRLIDPKNPHSFDPQFYAKTVAGAAIPQAANPDGEIELAAFMWIYTTTLPDGSVNDTYPPDSLLEAEGGTEPYIWSLVEGVEGYENLPPGLDLESDVTGTIWTISGTPTYNPNVTYPKTYNFAVQAEDDNGQTAYRSLSITVECIKHIITATATPEEGGTIAPSGAVEVVHGLNQTFTISPALCYEVENVVVDTDYPQGPVKTFTFTGVRKNHTISATFRKLTYTITAEAGPGGSIDPEGVRTVDCGSTPTFAITPATCYHVTDVLVDDQSVGAVTSYTFDPVMADYTIVATFAINEYIITATATEGGSIDPAGEETVICGKNKEFTITTDIGYQLVDVLVNGDPVDNITKGPLTTYEFINVMSNHTIRAVFKKLEAWVERYNNNSVNGDDEANDMVFNNFSGNIYVTGFSTGSPTGPDFYTLSYDGDGNVGLSARYDGPAHDGDHANAIAVDGDGNVYVTGYSFRGMAGKKHKDYCTLKYNSSRKLVWDSRYDARRNGNDEAADIAVDAAGNVYVTGSSEESLSKKSDVLHYDFYTIKYESGRRGRMVWGWGARYNNASANGADKATGIAVDDDGNVYVTGFSYNGTDNDIVTIKYDTDGNPVWLEEETGTGKLRRYDGGLNDEATDIAVDTAGNVYVTGRSQSSNTGYDYVTIKYSVDGTESWAVRHEKTDADEAVAIAFDAAGNVYVTGKSQGGGTGFDYLTIKYDSNNGSKLWERRYDNIDVNGDDEAADIAIDPAGDVYVTGKSRGSGTGFDYHTIKYDSSGNIIWRARYNNALLIGNDIATAIAVDTARNVFVTGRSEGTLTGFDFATVKYEQHIEFE